MSGKVILLLLAGNLLLVQSKPAANDNNGQDIDSFFSQLNQGISTPPAESEPQGFGGATRGFNQITITQSDNLQPSIINGPPQLQSQSSQSIQSSHITSGVTQVQVPVAPIIGQSNSFQQVLVPGSGLQQVGTFGINQVAVHQEDEAELRRQAQNARYQFATEVKDNISGIFQQRVEIREGTKVHGKYSYDDGFQWRTVYYEADENGYRVTKEEVVPSKMRANADGDVTVQSINNGNSVNYHITKHDIAARKSSNQQQYGVGSRQQQYGVAVL